MAKILQLKRWRRKSVVAMHPFLIQPLPCRWMQPIKSTSVLVKPWWSRSNCTKGLTSALASKVWLLICVPIPHGSVRLRKTRQLTLSWIASVRNILSMEVAWRMLPVLKMPTKRFVRLASSILLRALLNTWTRINWSSIPWFGIAL